jgi:putative redox protein
MQITIYRIFDNLGYKVQTTSSQQYITTIANANHTVISDEPIDVGGHDTGMKPMELLHGALAGCTSITMRMYANRKEWDLGEITIDVERIENEGEEPYLAKKIQFSANLDDAQKAKLMIIAGKCPVHKLLANAIEIKSEMV